MENENGVVKNPTYVGIYFFLIRVIKIKNEFF